MTIYQDYLKENILKQSGLTAWWPLDDLLAQPYARVLTPGIATGRNIVVNGTFDTDTIWTKGTGWTIASGVTHSDGTGGVATLTQSSSAIVTIGRAYTVTFTISNYVSGGIRFFLLGSAGQFTARSANGTFTETVVLIGGGASMGFLPVVSFVGDIDNVIVTELNIPPVGCSYSNPTLISDGDMEAVGTASWTAGSSATLSKQTGTPHGGSQCLRVAVAIAAGPDARQTILTIGQVYRATGYARSDGSAAVPRVFQTGLQPFTGTTSTSWQPFDFVFVAVTTSLQFGTSSTTVGQYVEFDDVTVTLDRSLRLGEIIQDGNMEASGTGVWVAVNNATLSKQGSAHGDAQCLRIASDGVTGNSGANQLILVIGKKYRITGFCRSDSNLLPRLQDGSTAFFTGTNSTSWQSVDVIATPTTTNLRIGASTVGSAGQYTEWDDLSVTEVHPMVGLPVNGVVQQAPALGHLLSAYSFDGTNDVVNAYSAQLNSVFNPSEGTLLLWAQVSSASIWTDGIQRQLMSLAADANNIIQIRKQTTNNTLLVGYTAASTVKAPTSTRLASYTGWFQVAITWSKTADQVWFFINGTAVGAPLTGLGTWVGNLATTSAPIGASSSAGAAPWSGRINDVRLYSRALSASEILREYRKYLPQFQALLWR